MGSAMDCSATYLAALATRHDMSVVAVFNADVVPFIVPHEKSRRVVWVLFTKQHGSLDLDMFAMWPVCLEGMYDRTHDGISVAVNVDYRF